MEMKFESQSFAKRLKSMLKVDFRRMFTTPLFYTMVGICLAIPILMLVMTTMTEGSVKVDEKTGVETIAEGYDNAWQIIGSASGESSGTSMDMTNMCNINMLYFFAAVFVGLFVTDDFKSGYAKNLFAVRSKKSDYVISKSIACIVCGVSMILAFLIGTILGGAISGLSFDAGTAGTVEIIMCFLSKMFLMSAFVPVYLLMSVVAKQKTWLSLVGSFCIGILFFSMIPVLTPLNSSIMNVVGCLAGGVLFNMGLGTVSNQILKRTSLV